MKEILRVDEAANYLRIAVPTLYRWVEEQRIEHVRLGRRILFRREDLDNHIAERVVSPKEKI